MWSNVSNYHLWSLTWWFFLENRTNSSLSRLPCISNFATFIPPIDHNAVESVIWFQLLSRQHFIGYDWRGNKQRPYLVMLPNINKLDYHFIFREIRLRAQHKYATRTHEMIRNFFSDMPSFPWLLFDGNLKLLLNGRLLLNFLMVNVINGLWRMNMWPDYTHQYTGIYFKIFVYP
jgi:hypothetical protein